MRDRELGKIVGVSLSKSQLDRLGERLREDKMTAEDLRLLDEYRRSFSGGYEHVVGTIRDELRLESTGRPAKSTTSIRDKLRRESIRLSQIQDIAGCRIVVPDILAQDSAVEALIGKLGNMKVFDRRARSSHGYRAVHLIAQCFGRPIEIQVRSALQHMWAELSEKISDVIDPALKYGHGPEWWSAWLLDASNNVAESERLQRGVQELKIEAGPVSHVPEVADRLNKLEIRLIDLTTKHQNSLRVLIARMSK